MPLRADAMKPEDAKKIDERYEGNFLEGADLPEGKLVPVEIEDVLPPNSQRDKQKKLIDKAILKFKGKAKTMIVNSTNYRVLQAMFGKASSSDWTGQKIKLQRRYLHRSVAFGDHNSPCVRIIPPIGTPLKCGMRRFMGLDKPYPEDADKP